MKDSLLDILYDRYSRVCQKQLASYVREYNNMDDDSSEDDQGEDERIGYDMKGPLPFQYCILEPFMSLKNRGLNIEELLSKSSKHASNEHAQALEPVNSSSTSSSNQESSRISKENPLKLIENAISDGEYNFGQLLKFDKRSMSHIQYVREYCGVKNFDLYLQNNCHIKSLAGENCYELKQEMSDCVSNLACDRVRDAFIECRSDLMEFDNASLVKLLFDTKDIHYGGMKESQCGLQWKDLLYCIDKYTVLGGVIKPDRRLGSLRYAPLDEESFRRYKQFARKEAKRLREDMESNL